MASSIDDVSDLDEHDYEESDQRLRQLQPLNSSRPTEEVARIIHAGRSGNHDGDDELRSRRILLDDQQTQTAPLLSVDTAAEAVPCTAPSSPYRRTLHHSSSAPSVPATSPMMSDLLLALQQSQSEEKKARVNTDPISAYTTTTNNNIRAWMNPPPITDYVDNQNEDDDDVSEYHSPLEEATSDERTDQDTKTNPGLRASLDAGMATMGRWVRSKKAVTIPPPQEVQEESNKSDRLASSANLFQSSNNQIEFQNDIDSKR